MSFLSRLFRVGTLPAPLREQFEPEGIIHVAEKVRVRKRFSGAVPGRHDALGVNRHIGLMVFTRQRLYALLPTLQMLKEPAIDQRWDAAQEGPARVGISGDGVKVEFELPHIDARFRGEMSLDFRTPLTDDVLAALPCFSLAFAVSPTYVFHMLGVRAKP